MLKSSLKSDPPKDSYYLDMHLCKKYMNQMCPHGEKCELSHETKEWPCKYYFGLGSCEVGSSCPYRHHPRLSPKEKGKFMVEEENYLLEILEKNGTTALGGAFLNYLERRKNSDGDIVTPRFDLIENGDKSLKEAKDNSVSSTSKYYSSSSSNTKPGLSKGAEALMTRIAGGIKAHVARQDAHTGEVYITPQPTYVKNPTPAKRSLQEKADALVSYIPPQDMSEGAKSIMTSLANAVNSMIVKKKCLKTGDTFATPAKDENIEFGITPTKKSLEEKAETMV